MSVVCQCPSCQAKYQVGDQYAGRTIKCPKCSAAVVVPTAAQPTNHATTASKPAPAEAAQATPPSKGELPKAQAVGVARQPQAKPLPAAKVAKAVAIAPVDAETDDEYSGSTPTEDDGLGFLAEQPAPPKRRPPPAVVEQPPAEDNGLGFLDEEPVPAKSRPVPAIAKQSPAASEPEDGLASIAGLAKRQPAKGVTPHYTKKKKQQLPTWVIPTIAGGAVVAIAGIVWGVVALSSSPTKPKNASIVSSSTPSDGKAATTNGTTGIASKPVPKGPVLTLNWAENQRAGASWFVDGTKQELPPTNPIKVPLPAKKDQYELRFERPGFQTQMFRRAAQEDWDYTVSEWAVLEPKGIPWPQDFKEAKKTAANEKKNILILFDASDAKENSFQSGRMKEAVVKRDEFRKRTDKEYVCVYIDNPKNAEAQAEVKDAKRNEELTTKTFKITVFPTVVVTDAKGRPFGILEGYTIKGINPFLELMDKWAADAKHFFPLFEKFQAMSKESPDADIAGEVLDFLEVSKLGRFYAKTVTKATACLPKEGRPVSKEVADGWMRRFAMAARNSDEAKKVIEEFDNWKKTRTFEDKEVGATLHLVAAIILGRLDLRKEALKKCQEGLAFQPHNPMLRATLERYSLILSAEPGKPVLVPVGSGSGYCIAEGNYLLTNHHVIHGAKEIKVRLNGQTEMYPAKLVADNSAGDMAILKVDLPAAKKLVPLPLMANELKIGEDVTVMGWPGMMRQNLSLTLTKGVVSTVPDTDDNESFIVTDCTVNPGNSGGPMCSFAGGVAGMVTRKSSITSNQSSYGMAIPVSRLRKFLAEKLPKDARMPSAQAGSKGTNMKLSELAEKIAPSVVYIENIQETRVPGHGAKGQGEEEDEDSGE